MQQFSPQWEPQLVASGMHQRQRQASALHPNETMTIAVAFHHSYYWTCRTFKAYYTEHVQRLFGKLSSLAYPILDTVGELEAETYWREESKGKQGRVEQ